MFFLQGRQYSRQRNEAGLRPFIGLVAGLKLASPESREHGHVAVQHEDEEKAVCEKVGVHHTLCCV